MALFNFNFNATNDNNNDNNQPKDVVLQVNEDSVTVPAADAAGKTVAQLFSDYAEMLGADVSRISRYINAGRIVDGSTTVTGGTVYRGAIASEAKG